MLKRLAILVAILAVVGGTIWWLLNDSPHKKIRSWRQASRFFFNEAGDLATAENINKKILEFLPNSIQDRFFKARILESKGDIASLQAAADLLEELVSDPNPRLLSLNLNRARILRTLGRLSEAQGAARSVADLFPFESNLETARISLAALDLYGALKSAKSAHDELAKDAFSRAQAKELEASIYFMLLGYKGNQNEKTKADINKAARAALDLAISAAKDVPEDLLPANQYNLWMASLYEKRSRVRAPGESPCWSAAKILDSKLADLKRRAKDVPEHLYTAIGALKLRAATEEKNDIPDRSPQVIQSLLDQAQESFTLALANTSPEDAKPLLEKAPPSKTSGEGQALAQEIDEELKSRRDYVMKLLHISKIFLASPLHSHLISDSTALKLSQRVNDARTADDESVSKLFSMVVAFAKLKEGKAQEAESILVEYAKSQEKGLQASAYLDLCRQSLKVLADQSVALRFIDLYDQMSPKDELVNRKLRLLLQMKKEPKLSEEAQKRIDKTLANLKSQPIEKDSDPLARARILQSLDSAESALEYLRKARKASPDSPSLRMAVGTFLLQQAQNIEVEDQARDLYRQAIADLLPTLFDSPESLPLVNRQLNFAFTSLQKLASDEDLSELLEKPYPNASPGDRKMFLETVRAFLSGDFKATLEHSNKLKSPSNFQPFLSLLRGVSLVENAGDAQDQSQIEPLLTAAKKEFNAHPELIANRFELAHLKLRDVPSGQDVPKELMDEVISLNSAKGVKGKGDWLMARALDFHVRYLKQQQPPNNDLIQDQIEKIQHHLRRTIAADPLKTPAYVALSRSFEELASMKAINESKDQIPKLIKEAHEQSVMVLRAVPAPNHAVISKLSGHLISLNQEKESFPYLASINLLDPRPQYMNSLMQNLIRNPEISDWALWALGETDQYPVKLEGDHLPKLKSVWRKFSDDMQSRNPSQYLLSIRTIEDLLSGETTRDAVKAFLFEDIKEKWEALPHYEGMRNMYIGEIHSAAYQSPELTRKQKAEHLGKMLDAYEASIKAYEAKKLPAPLAVLNNAAWFLAVESPRMDLERALELAIQAKDRLRTPADLPDVYDTYAWILYRNKRLSEAKNEYQILISSKDSPNYRYNMAKVLFDLQDYRAAQDELTKALNALDFQYRKQAIQLQAQVRKKLLEQSR